MKRKKLKKKVSKSKSKGKKSGSKKKKKSGYKRGSLGNGIRALFDKKGVDNVTYEECEKLAKSILPTTKFNKSHFSWYKNDYANREDE
jgi:hypothetical protein